MEFFTLLFDHLASVFEWHKRFKEGRESVRDEEMKEAVTKVIDTLTQEDFYGAFQKMLEWYNKCVAAGGDYIKGG